MKNNRCKQCNIETEIEWRIRLTLENAQSILSKHFKNRNNCTIEEYRLQKYARYQRRTGARTFHKKFAFDTLGEYVKLNGLVIDDYGSDDDNQNETNNTLSSDDENERVTLFSDLKTTNCSHVLFYPRKPSVYKIVSGKIGMETVENVNHNDDNDDNNGKDDNAKIDRLDVDNNWPQLFLLKRSLEINDAYVDANTLEKTETIEMEKSDNNLGAAVIRKLTRYVRCAKATTINSNNKTKYRRYRLALYAIMDEYQQIRYEFALEYEFDDRDTTCYTSMYRDAVTKHLENHTNDIASNSIREEENKKKNEARCDTSSFVHRVNTEKVDEILDCLSFLARWIVTTTNLFDETNTDTMIQLNIDWIPNDFGIPYNRKEEQDRKSDNNMNITTNNNNSNNNNNIIELQDTDNNDINNSTRTITTSTKTTTTLTSRRGNNTVKTGKKNIPLPNNNKNTDSIDDNIVEKNCIENGSNNDEDTDNESANCMENERHTDENKCNENNDTTQTNGVGGVSLNAKLLSLTLQNDEVGTIETFMAYVKREIITRWRENMILLRRKIDGKRVYATYDGASKMYCDNGEIINVKDIAHVFSTNFIYQMERYRERDSNQIRYCLTEIVAVRNKYASQLNALTQSFGTSSTPYNYGQEQQWPYGLDGTGLAAHDVRSILNFWGHSACSTSKLVNEVVNTLRTHPNKNNNGKTKLRRQLNNYKKQRNDNKNKDATETIVKTDDNTVTTTTATTSTTTATTSTTTVTTSTTISNDANLEKIEETEDDDDDEDYLQLDVDPMELCVSDEDDNDGNKTVHNTGTVVIKNNENSNDYSETEQHTNDVVNIDLNAYDANGYDAFGYDREGYDAMGYDRSGYDRDKRDKHGVHLYELYDASEITNTHTTNNDESYKEDNDNDKSSEYSFIIDDDDDDDNNDDEHADDTKNENKMEKNSYMTIKGKHIDSAAKRQRCHICDYLENTNIRNTKLKPMFATNGNANRDFVTLNIDESLTFLKRINVALQFNTTKPLSPSPASPVITVNVPLSTVCIDEKILLHNFDIFYRYTILRLTDIMFLIGDRATCSKLLYTHFNRFEASRYMHSYETKGNLLANIYNNNCPMDGFLLYLSTENETRRQQRKLFHSTAIGLNNPRSILYREREHSLKHVCRDQKYKRFAQSLCVYDYTINEMQSLSWANGITVKFKPYQTIELLLRIGLITIHPVNSRNDNCKRVNLCFCTNAATSEQQIDLSAHTYIYAHDATIDNGSLLVNNVQWKRLDGVNITLHIDPRVALYDKNVYEFLCYNETTFFLLSNRVDKILPDNENKVNSIVFKRKTFTETLRKLAPL